jgi:lipopolysaccharide transport system ATP-binding protein
VGTGFHPELTGRENIYLNGAILGMTRAEIKRKFDEIVDFSGVEKFLDTPVKRYSSGMYVRLAFAVAAHLEPEILIVDEVLAVGDYSFQSKCLGKMSEIASGGRTVLFVSHNLQAVRTLCKSVVVLRDGQIVQMGRPGDSIQRYLEDYRRPFAMHWSRPLTMPIKGAGFQEVSVSVQGEQPSLVLCCSCRVRVNDTACRTFLAVDISNSLGAGIMQALPDVLPFIPDAAGDYDLYIEITLPPLIPGLYCVSFWLGPHNTITYDFIESVVAFEVVSTPTAGRVFPHSVELGYIVPQSKCTLVHSTTAAEHV